MGGKITSPQPTEQTPPAKQRHERPLSDFYLACRDGRISDVKELLPLMSVEQINCFEPNGSTALHAAAYYGHAEIVQSLLNAGACRSTENLRSQLTAFQEARDDHIRKLFSHAYSSPQRRFLGSSSKVEWSLDTFRAAEWKTHLSSILQLKLPFRTVVSYLLDNYCQKYVHLPSDELERIIRLFRQAYRENHPIYIVKAYTTPTKFYAVVNHHLAEHLLGCFRWENEKNVLVQCVEYLASIFLHQPELRFMEFTGTVYRGLLLLKSDLETYIVNKHLLNKAFLSTTKDRSVALVYAACGDHTHMRRTVDKTPLQYTALCTYIIRNRNTALDISRASEVASEHEVLIMPLSAFQVRSVHRNDEANNDIQIQIVLEECNESVRLKRKLFSDVT